MHFFDQIIKKLLSYIFVLKLRKIIWGSIFSLKEEKLIKKDSARLLSLPQKQFALSLMPFGLRKVTVFSHVTQYNIIKRRMSTAIYPLPLGSPSNGLQILCESSYLSYPKRFVQTGKIVGHVSRILENKAKAEAAKAANEQSLLTEKEKFLKPQAGQVKGPSHLSCPPKASSKTPGEVAYNEIKEMKAEDSWTVKKISKEILNPIDQLAKASVSTKMETKAFKLLSEEFLLAVKEEEQKQRKENLSHQEIIDICRQLGLVKYEKTNDNQEPGGSDGGLYITKKGYKFFQEVYSNFAEKNAIALPSIKEPFEFISVLLSPEQNTKVDPVLLKSIELHVCLVVRTLNGNRFIMIGSFTSQKSAENVPLTENLQINGEDGKDQYFRRNKFITVVEESEFKEYTKGREYLQRPDVHFKLQAICQNPETLNKTVIPYMPGIEAEWLLIMAEAAKKAQAEAILANKEKSCLNQKNMISLDENEI